MRRANGECWCEREEPAGPGGVSTIFVSAGEPSGDAHAAALVGELARLLPESRFEGFGGPRLEAAGVRLIERMERLTVIGLVESLKKIPAHLRLLRRMEERFRAGVVDLVVVVDYPGFHLRVAAAARQAGIPVLYYIAPTAWAWHESRVERLRRDVAHLAVILPFEEEFFRSRGVRATFVGNPLLDALPQPRERPEAKRNLGLDPSRPVLGVFPGSRSQEVRRLWPCFRDAAALVRSKRPDVQVLVAGVEAGEYGGAGFAAVVRGRAPDCFAASDAALCKSGTTTLEAALHGVPQVIAYRMNAVSFRIASVLVRTRWVGLVNLIAGREVVPEFLQGAARPAALAEAVLPLLDDTPQRRLQLAGIEEVRRRLGPPGAAARAAAIARSLLAA